MMGWRRKTKARAAEAAALEAQVAEAEAREAAAVAAAHEAQAANVAAREAAAQAAREAEAVRQFEAARVLAAAEARADAEAVARAAAEARAADAAARVDDLSDETARLEAQVAAAARLQAHANSAVRLNSRSVHDTIEGDDPFGGVHFGGDHFGGDEDARGHAAPANTLSAARLYELVNESLLANFGPAGSYAITSRRTSDCDDVFHTMLASSVAHSVVENLVLSDLITIVDTLPAAPVVPDAPTLAPAVFRAPPRFVAPAPPVDLDAGKLDQASLEPALAPLESVEVPAALAAAVAEIGPGSAFIAAPVPAPRAAMPRWAIADAEAAAKTGPVDVAAASAVFARSRT